MNQNYIKTTVLFLKVKLQWTLIYQNGFIIYPIHKKGSIRPTWFRIFQHCSFWWSKFKSINKVLKWVNFKNQNIKALFLSPPDPPQGRPCTQHDSQLAKSGPGRHTLHWTVCTVSTDTGFHSSPGTGSSTAFQTSRPGQAWSLQSSHSPPLQCSLAKVGIWFFLFNVWLSVHLFTWIACYHTQDIRYSYGTEQNW